MICLDPFIDPGSESVQIKAAQAKPQKNHSLDVLPRVRHEIIQTLLQKHIIPPSDDVNVRRMRSTEAVEVELSITAILPEGFQLISGEPHHKKAQEWERSGRALSAYLL